ncbi:RagB/SusD family nutrient uptake outer membrane protein [Butyricimonas paravirosa]
MKKILYILLIGLFSSCDSLLDVEPETLVSFDNFYKSEQDLEVTLYQLHSFINGRLMDQHVQEEAGLIMEPNTTRNNIWSPSSIVGSPAVGSIQTDWMQIYWVVYMANVLLDNVYKAEAQVTPERIAYYKAQAYFGKAIGYFFLARRWGEVTITRNSSSSEVYGKKPLLEVLDTVLANATRAYHELPVYGAVVDRSGAVIKSKQFGSKGAACALLAHAYAWKGSMIDLMELDGNSRECYDKSIEYSSLLIKGDAGAYSLVRNPEKLCQLFSDITKENPESIWEFTLDMQRDFISSTYLVGRQLIGYPVDPAVSESDQKNADSKISYKTIKQLYDTLDLRTAYFYKYDYYSCDTLRLQGIKDEALRQHAVDSIRKRINEITGGYAYPFKWREAITEVDANIPWISKLVAVKSNYSYWRLADIYLLRAECFAKIGENGLAEADLNEIREYNNVNAYPDSGGDEKGLKYAIFHERERELLMEGQRFFDIVRNGMEYINAYLPSDFQKLTRQDVKNGAIFFPICTNAFELNNLLRQNIYWAQYMN